MLPAYTSRQRTDDAGAQTRQARAPFWQCPLVAVLASSSQARLSTYRAGSPSQCVVQHLFVNIDWQRRIAAYGHRDSV